MANFDIENEIVMRPINTIKPYVRNPRKNSKTVDLLVEMIPKVGFNVPLVIDERGIIVKGHARFSAAIKLGMTEVPCIITHADEEAIKADRIADNKISELSEWVGKELIEEVNDIDFDLSDIGLPKIILADFPTDEGMKREFVEEAKPEIEAEYKEEEKDDDEFEDALYYKCVCDKCGYTMFIREDEVS